MLAPLYAVTEGLALGGISRRFFEESSKGIVPGDHFTGAVFFGAILAAYRAGLVR